MKGNTDAEWHKVKGIAEWMKTLFLNWHYAEEEKYVYATRDNLRDMTEVHRGWKNSELFFT